MKRHQLIALLISISFVLLTVILRLGFFSFSVEASSPDLAPIQVGFPFEWMDLHIIPHGDSLQSFVSYSAAFNPFSLALNIVAVYFAVIAFRRLGLFLRGRLVRAAAGSLYTMRYRH